LVIPKSVAKKKKNNRSGSIYSIAGKPKGLPNLYSAGNVCYRPPPPTGGPLNMRGETRLGAFNRSRNFPTPRASIRAKKKYSKSRLNYLGNKKHFLGRKDSEGEKTQNGRGALEKNAVMLFGNISEGFCSREFLLQRAGTTGFIIFKGKGQKDVQTSRAFPKTGGALYGIPRRGQGGRWDGK